MKQIVKYIMLICLVTLAFFHLYYDGSTIWKCLYFGVEYFSLSVLLIYIGLLMNKILKKKDTHIQKGDPLFFGILSTYFLFKLWYNTQFYYPMFDNMDLHNLKLWGGIATIVVICVLIGLQILIVTKYVEKR